MYKKTKKKHMSYVAGAAGGSLFYQTTTLTGIFLFLLFFFQFWALKVSLAL